MNDLFNEKGAEFSEDGKYRYVLWRIWDRSKPHVMFIGLNPSTADHQKDDPTIRRIVSFAKKWGFGGVYMTNLFGLVSPNPEELLKSDDPVGDTDKWIDNTAVKCDEIVFAWGAFEEAKSRAKEVTKRWNGSALKVNRDGSPRHPLYVPGNTNPINYKTPH